MLKLKFSDERENPFWVMERSYTIGSAKDNHLIIDEEGIAAHHAKIINHGDTFLIRDMGTDAGVCVNGRRVTQKSITCGDKIKIAQVELDVIDPFSGTTSAQYTYWSLIADSSWLSGQEFPLIPKTGNKLLLGRGKGCDLVFPGTHLSRQHAEITVFEKHLLVKDLKSSNGTYLNDKQIEEEYVKPGDRLRLDIYSFKVFGPGIDLPAASTSFFQKPNATELLEPSSDSQQNHPVAEKQWITKPTSPGNREEHDLYKKNFSSTFIAIALILALLCISLYIFL